MSTYKQLLKKIETRKKKLTEIDGELVLLNDALRTALLANRGNSGDRETFLKAHKANMAERAPILKKRDKLIKELRALEEEERVYSKPLELSVDEAYRFMQRHKTRW